MTDVELKPDEQITPFLRDRLKIIQKKRGVRFSMDPIWLAHFVRRRAYRSVAELGCGTGIALFILGLRFPKARMFGIEILERYADMAARAAVLNGFERRCNIVCGDFRNIRKFAKPASFDLVVSNPPFLPEGRVRRTKDPERATFRYEITSSIDDVVRAAGYLLKQGGDFAIIFDAQRVSDLIYGLRKEGFGIRRMRFVHPLCHRSAERVMVEAKKGRNPTVSVEPPLVVHGEDKKFSDEVEDYLEGRAL